MYNAKVYTVSRPSFRCSTGGGRFKSEACNDMAYFTVLLRYIHQNPVKAGIAERVKDYEYSSWGEFDGTVEPEKRIESRPSDDQVWLMIKERTGATSSTAFQQLADETKRNILKRLKDSGASHRQLERLTGVGRGLIQKL